MYLTTSNAHLYVGKIIDCQKTKPFFHHYPLRVVKGTDGRYYYIDRCDTRMYVPTESDTFNSVYFDTVEEA